MSIKTDPAASVRTSWSLYRTRPRGILKFILFYFPIQNVGTYLNFIEEIQRGILRKNSLLPTSQWGFCFLRLHPAGSSASASAVAPVLVSSHYYSSRTPHNPSPIYLTHTHTSSVSSHAQLLSHQSSSTSHLTHLIFPTSSTSHLTQYTAEPLESLAARVLRCVASAIHSPPEGPAARRVALWWRLAVVWQAQYTEPPEGPAARHGRPDCCVTSAAWQAQYTKLPEAPAARRSRLAVVWEAQYTEPPEGPAAHLTQVRSYCSSPPHSPHTTHVSSHTTLLAPLISRNSPHSIHLTTTHLTPLISQQSSHTAHLSPLISY